MAEFYINDKRNLYDREGNKPSTKKERKQEVIKNLTNTIKKESLKIGGGNKDLIAKFQDKLDNLENK